MIAWSNEGLLISSAWPRCVRYGMHVFEMMLESGNSAALQFEMELRCGIGI